MQIPLELDLASFESIKQFAFKIRTKYSTFDCLINNAGLATRNYQMTKESYEMVFGTNHLGHFLLFQQLKDIIDQNQPRIVIVASKMHERGKIDFDTIGKITEATDSKTMRGLYANSKLANVYFARELYKRGYDAHVLCPGLCNTDFFRDYNPKWYHYVLFSPIVWLMLRSSKQGAQNIIYCATDNINTEDENPAKGYFITSLKQIKSKINFVDTISEKLWNESLKMCEV